MSEIVSVLWYNRRLHPVAFHHDVRTVCQYPFVLLDGDRFFERSVLKTRQRPWAELEPRPFNLESNVCAVSSP